MHARTPHAKSPVSPRPPAAHSNNIGLLRLLLACGVIVGHAPELIDGDRHREPLTRLFGTLSLGELCVDAFFLLSGYLIAKSITSPGATIGGFVRRRVFRLFPAFVVAYAFSCFVIGGLAGGAPWSDLPRTLLHLAALQPPPDYGFLFPGKHHYLTLNGPMWTLAYEFRCYVLLAGLWAAGLLQRRAAMALLAAAAVLASIAIRLPCVAPLLHALPRFPLQSVLLGQPDEAIRLTSTFLVGSLFHLYRDLFDRVLDDRPAIALLAAGALVALSDPLLAEPCLVTFAALPLFWLALRARLGGLQRLNASWDISYGVYLYGWPVATYAYWTHPDIGPAQLAIVALLAASCLGGLSWWGVERWFKEGVRRHAQQAAASMDLLGALR